MTEQKVLGTSIGEFVAHGAGGARRLNNTSGKRRKRRVNYDPKARDADADQLIQEGTTAERRVGGKPNAPTVSEPRSKLPPRKREPKRILANEGGQLRGPTSTRKPDLAAEPKKITRDEPWLERDQNGNPPSSPDFDPTHGNPHPVGSPEAIEWERQRWRNDPEAQARAVRNRELEKLRPQDRVQNPAFSNSTPFDPKVTERIHAMLERDKETAERDQIAQVVRENRRMASIRKFFDEADLNDQPPSVLMSSSRRQLPPRKRPKGPVVPYNPNANPKPRLIRPGDDPNAPAAKPRPRFIRPPSAPSKPIPPTTPAFAGHPAPITLRGSLVVDDLDLSDFTIDEAIQARKSINQMTNNLFESVDLTDVSSIQGALMFASAGADRSRDVHVAARRLLENEVWVRENPGQVRAVQLEFIIGREREYAFKDIDHNLASHVIGAEKLDSAKKLFALAQNEDKSPAERLRAAELAEEAYHSKGYEFEYKRHAAWEQLVRDAISLRDEIGGDAEVDKLDVSDEIREMVKIGGPKMTARQKRIDEIVKTFKENQNDDHFLVSTRDDLRDELEIFSATEAENPLANAGIQNRVKWLQANLKMIERLLMEQKR